MISWFLIRDKEYYLEVIIAKTDIYNISISLENIVLITIYNVNVCAEKDFSEN
jgi:hypothetical protein